MAIVAALSSHLNNGLWFFMGKFGSFVQRAIFRFYVLSKTSLGKKCIGTNGKEHEQEIGGDYQNRVNHV
jgi:hypothetical protein